MLLDVVGELVRIFKNWCTSQDLRNAAEPLVQRVVRVPRLQVLHFNCAEPGAKSLHYICNAARARRPILNVRTGLQVSLVKYLFLRRLEIWKRQPRMSKK